MLGLVFKLYPPLVVWHIPRTCCKRLQNSYKSLLSSPCTRSEESHFNLFSLEKPIGYSFRCASVHVGKSDMSKVLDFPVFKSPWCRPLLCKYPKRRNYSRRFTTTQITSSRLWSVPAALVQQAGLFPRSSPVLS